MVSLGTAMTLARQQEDAEASRAFGSVTPMSARNALGWYELQGQTKRVRSLIFGGSAHADERQRRNEKKEKKTERKGNAVEL